MLELLSSARATRLPFRVWPRVLLLLGILLAIVQPIVAAVATQKVRFYMNMGTVEIELYGNESPLHVANFLSYVDAGDYDDSFIHRTRAFNPSQPFSHDLFAQGGSFHVPTGQFIDGDAIVPGSPVPNEFNAANGLSNLPGSLAAARTSDPDSATSGWFINQSDNSASFDAGPYTVFGQVTLGMSIIDDIPFLPNYEPFEGSGFESTPFFNGSLVVIERATRISVAPGDYNFDGVVNSADYNLWRSNFGSTASAAADGSGDGVVNAADYAIWRDSRGSTGVGSATAVPEPATLALLTLSMLALSVGFHRLPRALLCLLAIAASATAAVGNSFVRLDYNLTLDERSRNVVFIELFEDRPLTHDNFLQYVNAGHFDGVLMHRLVPDFVLQGGGFYERRLEEPHPLNISLDPTFRVDLDGNPTTPNPTVNNEFNNQPFRSNLRGTLSMAKAAGNPNSATNEFFFNLDDNDATSEFNNLDVDNGGFTVFARVVGDGMALIDAFASLELIDLNPDANDDGIRDGGVFGALPFFDTTLVKINRAQRIDYLGAGAATNVPAGGLVFGSRDAFIDTGATFGGTGNIVVGEGRTLGIRENFSLSRPLINRGTLQPGLQLGSISAPSYLQEDTGTLDIQLRGTDVLTEYDSLFIIGTAQLAGKLDIQLINQYMPVHGNSFTVFSAADVDGSFDQIDLPLLTPGLVWSVDTTSSAITLHVAAADFNQNGRVDAADYTLWRDSKGRTGENLVADANGDGVVDEADLAIWRGNFGSIRGNVVAGAGAATAVPEPSAAALSGILIAMAAWIARRKRLRPRQTTANFTIAPSAKKAGLE